MKNIWNKISNLNWREIFKTDLKEKNVESMHYKEEARSLAITSLCLSVVLMFAWLTSDLTFPKIPLIGGHPDIWYGIAVISFVFIKDKKYRMLFLISLPFALMLTELHSYAGMYDYFLELMCPMIALLLMIIQFKNISMLLVQVIIVICIYMGFRTLFITLAGVEIYGVTWKASLVFNFPNIGLDWAISVIVSPLALSKLIKIKA